MYCLRTRSINAVGWIGTGVGRGLRGKIGEDEEFAEIELQLDIVFFDDGLCVGPDESGLFDNVREHLEQQRGAAQEIVRALRHGASSGAVFEILRPLARHGEPQATARRRRHPAYLLSMFANAGIHRLINGTDPEVLAWFEDAARPSSIQLRRSM